MGNKGSRLRKEKKAKEGTSTTAVEGTATISHPPSENAGHSADAPSDEQYPTLGLKEETSEGESKEERVPSTEGKIIQTVSAVDIGEPFNDGESKPSPNKDRDKEQLLREAKEVRIRRSYQQVPTNLSFFPSFL